MNQAETNKEDKSTTSLGDSFSTNHTLPLFRRAWRYFNANKKWIFSGIGVLILSLIVGTIRYFILQRDGTPVERSPHDLATTVALLVFLGFVIAAFPLILAILYAAKCKAKSHVVYVHHTKEEAIHTLSDEDSDLHTRHTPSQVSTSIIVDLGHVFAIFLMIAGFVGIIFLAYKYFSTLLAILGLLILAGDSSDANAMKKNRTKRKKIKKKKISKKKKVAKKKKTRKKKTKRSRY